MRLHSVNSRSHGRVESWTPIALPFGIIAALIIFTVVFFVSATIWVQDIGLFRCLPNGSATYHPNTTIPAGVVYSDYGDSDHARSTLWESQQFLSITLGFGSFTFAGAKGTDVAWDLLVGRGGQVLLTIVSYPIFRRSLVRIMEIKGTSIQVFAALAFDGVSLRSIGTLASRGRRSIKAERSGVKEMQRYSQFWLSLHRAWNWRLVLFFLAFAYILSFPTWLSVMTGYQAQLASYVKTNNGTLAPTSQLTIPDAMVYNGSRIGLSHDQYTAVFSNEQPALYQALKAYSALWENVLGNATENRYANLTSSLTINGTGCSFTIPAHTRYDLPNGTYVDIGSSLSSAITVHNTTWDLAPPPLYIDPYNKDDQEFFALGDELIEGAVVIESLVCEPASAYQWGFSSQLLFTFCILSIVFAAIMTTLHLDAYWNGHSERSRRPTNVYRDVLDLAQELRKQFGEDAQDTPAPELRTTVEQEGAAMQVQTETLPPSRSHDRAMRRQA
ncbi:hypothetical protein LTR85_011162 [Meristemomyces frigidus]|nr:hypothetical protein LTR85_011162 [Meristemomyces frigidus]